MYANAILSANYGDGAEEIGQKLLTGEMKHTDPEVMLVYDCMEQFATYLEPGVTGIAYSDAPAALAAGNMAMYADGSCPRRTSCAPTRTRVRLLPAAGLDPARTA